MLHSSTHRFSLTEVAFVPELLDVAIMLAVVRYERLLKAWALGRVGKEALGRELRLGVLLFSLRERTRYN